MMMILCIVMAVQPQYVSIFISLLLIVAMKEVNFTFAQNLNLLEYFVGFKNSVSVSTLFAADRLHSDLLTLICVYR